jgi:hypothetical protein
LGARLSRWPMVRIGNVRWPHRASELSAQPPLAARLGSVRSYSHRFRSLGRKSDAQIPHWGDASSAQAKATGTDSRRMSAGSHGPNLIRAMSSPRIGWMSRLGTAARRLGPYVAVALVVPGGTLVLLSVFAYRSWQSALSHDIGSRDIRR